MPKLRDGKAKMRNSFNKYGRPFSCAITFQRAGDATLNKTLILMEFTFFSILAGLQELKMKSHFATEKINSIKI